MEMRADPIFIVGLPRCGSTLWLNLFFNHPEICRIRGELLYLSPFRRDFRYFLRKYAGDLSKRENVDAAVNLMFSRRAVPGIDSSFWNLELADLDEPEFRLRMANRIWNSDKSLGAFFKILLEQVTEDRGYSRFCAKFPVHLSAVPTLAKWYPDAKIVHVIRDPRAIAASRSNDPGGTQIRVRENPRLGFLIRKLSMAFGVAQYMWASRLHKRFRNWENYALFRFEDLLADPERDVRRLCDFTETPFLPAMLHPKAGQASSFTGKTSSGFNRDAVNHWKKMISPFEERLIRWFTWSSRKRFV